MRNQCIEQCAIYTFFPCGSYLTWAFWPNIPLLVIFRSSCEEEIYQKVLLGWWYSVFGHEGLRGWELLAGLDCLDGDLARTACLWSLVYIEQSGERDLVQDRRLRELLPQTHLFAIGDVWKRTQPQRVVCGRLLGGGIPQYKVCGPECIW